MGDTGVTVHGAGDRTGSRGADRALAEALARAETCYDAQVKLWLGTGIKSGTIQIHLMEPEFYPATWDELYAVAQRVSLRLLPNSTFR